MKQTGFTLLEVVVALMILAGLALVTARITREALDSRAKYQYEMSRDASLRDAMRIMSTDVSAAFNFHDNAVEMFNQIVTATPPPTGPGSTNPGVGGTNPGVGGTNPGIGGTNPGFGSTNPQKPKPTPKPTPVQLTNFIGDEKSMYFTVSNHLRSGYNARESDLARVGYYTNSCKSRDPKHIGQPTTCLYRAYSTGLIEDVTRQPKTEMRLLENVQEFKLRYIVPGKDIGEDIEQAYVDAWKSDGKSAQDGKLGFFPFAVQINLTVHDPQEPRSKPTSMLALAPLRFPNNPTTTPTPAEKK